MIKTLFSIVALSSFVSNIACADLWVEEANDKGDLAVQWFFDEDYEDYDLCVKEDKWLKRWDCIGVHWSNNTHNSQKPNDVEYHGGRHHFGYGTLDNGKAYKVKVQGIYRSGKKKDDLAELTVRMGSVNKVSSDHRLHYSDFITAGGGHVNGEWMTGDFDGDGVEEVALAFNDGGNISIDVYDDSHGLGLVGRARFKRWITKSGGWPKGKWVVGDYNNDGKSDVGVIWDNKGTAVFQVYSSVGSKFSEMRWLYSNAGPYIQENHWFSGDFNNDGFDDLMRVHEDQRSTDFTILEGRGDNKFNAPYLFENNQGGFWDSQKWFSGDFNGDGVTDLAKIWRSNNAMVGDVHLSSGSDFSIERWANHQGGMWSSQKWFVADLDNDGIDDLGKAFWGDRGSVTVDAHFSRGSKFSMERISEKQGPWRDDAVFLGGNFYNSSEDNVMMIFSLHNRFTMGTL